MTDLPPSPAELSAIFRHMADMLDELHARREGTWLPDGPTNSFDDIEKSYGCGAEAWSNPAAQNFLRTMRGGLDEHEPGPPEKHPLDALIENLGGPLPDDVEPPSAGTLAAILADEPEPLDMTTTQANLLGFLRTHPRGFCPDRLATVVDNIVDEQASGSVISVYRAALNVLLERGLVHKVGALILAKEPEPEETIPLPGPSHEHERPALERRQPTDRQNLTAGEWDELGRLAKEPQTTYGKGRTRIQTRLVRFGFAHRFNTLEGERCAITDAGRERLTQGR